MEYLDFELRIRDREGEEYPLDVLDSPSGECRGKLRMDFNAGDLHQRIRAIIRGGAAGEARDIVRKRADAGSSEGASPESIGKQLFDALLPDDVRTCYRRSLDRARESGKGLRMRLRIDDAGLASVPWEFLYDESEGRHLSLSKQTPVLRYVELQQPALELAVAPPVRVLGMVASPNDLESLDVELEKERLAESVSHLSEHGYAEVHWVAGGTWRDLQNAMQDGPWHVFHFIGHGQFDEESDEGHIAFEGEDGKAELLSASRLSVLLTDHSTLRLVVLNSCEGGKGSGSNVFSSTASVLVRSGVAAVISMQYEITDRAALEFARTFYDSLLSRQQSVDLSLTSARKAIRLSSKGAEWGTPVLHVHAADSSLVKLDEAAAIYRGLSGASTTPAQEVVEPQLEFDPQLQILVQKVRDFWLRDTHSGELSPLSGRLDLVQEGTAPTATTESLLELFQRQRSLLILGDKGWGEAPALLSLTEALLDTAADGRHVVPVMLSLASWRGEPFSDWVVDSISARYNLPRGAVDQWFEDHCLTLLFDHLEEVPEKFRVRCVEALNDMAPELGLSGLVVACNFKDYIELPARLTLPTVVRVRPLTKEQIFEWLETVGPAGVTLREQLEEDPLLQILARSPAMLEVMLETCDHIAKTPTRVGSVSRRKEIVSAYVDRMFDLAEGDAS